MNLTKIIELRDTISKLRTEDFDMNRYLGFDGSEAVSVPAPNRIGAERWWASQHTCETAGCLAGWAVLTNEHAVDALFEEHEREMAIPVAAQRVLELSASEREFMFHGYWAQPQSLEDIELSLAIDYLDAVIANESVFLYAVGKDDLDNRTIFHPDPDMN